MTLARLLLRCVLLAVVAILGPAFLQGKPVLLLLWLGAFAVALGALAAWDLHERRLPNAITYPGTLIALVAAGVSGWDGLAMAAAGLAVAGGLAFAAWFLSRGSLGLGDVKLSAFVGAYLGVTSVVQYLFFGTLVGAAWAIALLAIGKGRRAKFAYGPSLIAGAVITLNLTSFAVALR